MINGPDRRRRLAYLLHRFDAHPFESLVCTLSLLAAGPILVLGGRPESVDRLLPEFLVRIWGFNLLVGAAMVLYGGIFREHRLLHRSGLNLVGSACLVYSIAVFIFASNTGAVGAVILLAIGMACVRRAFTLDRYVTIWAPDALDRLVNRSGRDPT